MAETKRCEVHILFEITDLYHVPFGSVMRLTFSTLSMGEVFLLSHYSARFSLFGEMLANLASLE